MKKILIVEDDAAIRTMMEKLLQFEGYTVVTAGDGRAGIETLQAHPDTSVVLLDMMMPGWNGWFFIDYLRNSEIGGRIPVVVVSAYREIARSVKPAAVVSKPVQLDTLLGAIERLVA